MFIKVSSTSRRIDRMTDIPNIGAIAALIGDPSRGRMLSALMDGRALTATELALEAGVTPSTASSHLAQLEHAGLIAIVKQGRHRYVRIAGDEIATTLETLMGLAARSTAERVRTGPRDEGLRRARVCYDHLAGDRAVQLLGLLRAKRYVRDDGESLALTPAGTRWCAAIGIDVDAFTTRRPLLRPCLDWSERRTHLAGALGAALLDRMFALRLARREPRGRAVVFSPRGERFVSELVLSR
jgi:DNA-binding transcriptional ArsR family regulator